MVSGQVRHSDAHRPLYPEYGFREKNKQCNLYLLEGYRIYDRRGNGYPCSTTPDVLNFLADNHGAAYVHSLADRYSFPHLDGMVGTPEVQVNCSKSGIPHLVHIQCGRSTRWIIEAGDWGEVAEPSMIDHLWDVFEYVDLGWAPTYSSLGNRMMQYVYWLNWLGRHTALSLACEEYLRKHGFGAISVTPGLGNEYDEAAHLDMAAAYVSKYIIHPNGGGVWFTGGHCDKYATWFAECQVEVLSELPLGPFPIRRPRKDMVAKKDWSRRNDYPTLPGKYKTFLWKEQAEDCLRAGCSVQPSSGFAWDSLTSDNGYWAEWAYSLRENAPTEHVKKKLKGVLVAAIGRQAAGRTHYYLVSEDRADVSKDRCMVSSFGEPMAYFIHEEWDQHTARMIHWEKYTISETNRAVYQFALPYAEQARLILIDTDCVIVLEEDEGIRYARKIPNVDILLGQWYYTQLHNLAVVGHRSFKSREITRLPGVGHESEYIPGFA